MEQKNQKGIRRDRKDFLQDKSRKETGKWIIPFATKMPVKSIVKGLWNKERTIKMLIQKLKKGRDIIHKHVLAV